MLSADRDALVCDMAETYGIFDIGALPVPLLATLAVGLRADSRIKMRLSGQKVARAEILLAAAVDRLSMLWWAQTENGHNNVNRPQSVLGILLGDTPQENDAEFFDSADSFEDAWERITGARHGR